MKNQYEKIAQSLINSTEEKWDKIMLEVTLNPVDDSKTIISYYSENGSNYSTYMIDDPSLNIISEAIDVLQKQNSGRRKESFSGFVFSLDKNHNFNIKYSYPD